MQETRIIMGMPVTVLIVDDYVTPDAFDSVFDYFTYVDEKFSPYKATSEVTKINNGQIKSGKYSQEMQTVLELSEKTKKETGGFFDIAHNGSSDPSGIVKGWAIHNAANILRKMGLKNFYVEAGGDIEVSGRNKDGNLWTVGIKNPFNPEQIVKMVCLDEKGIATSGTYLRGQHIYNPKSAGPITDIISLTVIGSNIYEADRFATAAFAMGRDGINFIDGLEGLEGYMIDVRGQATLTTGFEKYVKKDS